MKILLIFFLLAFLGLTVVFGVIRRIGKMLTGEEPEPKPRGRKRRAKGGVDTSNAKPRKKIISDDEGEYIDYEDVSGK